MANNSMFLDCYNINKDIELNNWKEVTTANFFISNTTELHPKGLFSTEIFGNTGTPERKTNWGWIALNDVFMNPHAFYVLQNLKRSIAEDMKTGANHYYVDKNGELTKLPQGQTVPADALYKNTGSGFDWLKQAWPYISWKITKDMSNGAKTKRKWLKSFDIDAIFWDKFPVCPAFYRDVDFKSNKRNIINTFYTRLLYHSEIIKNTDNLQFFNVEEGQPTKSNAHIKCQDLMNEISLFFFDKLGGANGFINKHAVGKTTDYGARLVITPPNFNYESYKDIETDFFHSSVPLAVAINIYAPFMIYAVKQWIENYVSGNRFITVYNPVTNSYENKELASSYMDEFTSDNIRRILDLYKKSKKYRVENITLKGVDERIPIWVHSKKNGKVVEFTSNVLSVDDSEKSPENFHKMTFCELFYIIAEISLKNKCIDTTRYPADDYYHMYPALMNIIPSQKYIEASFNGVNYKRFPDLNLKSEVDIEHSFNDTLKMFSIYPSSLGADFDGDQVSAQSLFSDEANEEAIKQMNNISHVLGIDGEIMREFPNVIKHGIYNLTYMNKKQ